MSCQYLFKKGLNKGKTCNATILPNKTYCNSHEYQEKHKDQINQKAKQYYINNKEQVIKQVTENRKKKTIPKYRKLTDEQKKLTNYELYKDYYKNYYSKKNNNIVN